MDYFLSLFPRDVNNIIDFFKLKDKCKYSWGLSAGLVQYSNGKSIAYPMYTIVASKRIKRKRTTKIK